MKRKFFLLRSRFIFLTLILFFVGVIFGANFWVAKSSSGKIFRDVEKIPEKMVALVLGAGIKKNGDLSDILRDRLDSALELFAARKIRRIIVSGDNSRENYDETDAMRDYLLESGIPPRAIFTDYAGFDTFDSIFRAREIFEVNEAILVSQEFHLPRAIFLAEKLGIDAVGFSANLQEYLNAKRMQFREIPANVKAVGNILFNSQPKFLGEKIPIDGDGRESWDEKTISNFKF